MNNKSFFFLLLFLLFFSCNEGSSDSAMTSTMESRIDDYISKVSDRYKLPSTSVAIIKNGEVIYESRKGLANIEHQVPVSDNSIYRVYSLTKPIVCVGLFQLIEAGELSLEDKISMHLTDLPEVWANVQIKHLITHSSGIPDMVQFTEREALTEEEVVQSIIDKPMEFDLGETFQYNQTNYWILQRILDKVAGKEMEDFIIEGQFDSPSEAFFSSDSRTIISDRATPYFHFRTGEQIIDHAFVGDYMHSANGLNLTLDALISWDKDFRSGKYISEETKQAMWEEFIYEKPVRRFAYGWEKRVLNGHPSYGFSGSLVTAYRIFPEDDLSIIFLSNGLGKFFNVDDIVNHLAALVEEDIYDPNYEVYETLVQASYSETSSVVKVLEELREDAQYADTDFENIINNLGYYLMREDLLEKAITVFETNIENYPNSWNGYDSLGEALENIGDKARALDNYKKALELNVDNQLDHNDTLRERIERLTKEVNE